LIGFLFGKYAKHLPFSNYKERARMVEKVNSTIEDVVKRERKAFEQDKDEKGTRQARDILSLLFDAKDGEIGLTDQELRDEIKTFLFAGHETTSTLLGSLFYCLALYPEVEAKLLKEIDSVLQGRQPTADDVESKLPYLNQVVKETLRLYAPVPFVTRVTIDNEVLNGFVVPKGTRVVISPYLLHRHPRLWDEPDVFNPDRWAGAPESSESSSATTPSSTNEARQPVLRHPCAFIPFIIGPRNCIGQKFALLEAKILTAMILQSATFSLDPTSPPYVPTTRITLRPKEPLLYNIHPRERRGKDRVESPVASNNLVE